MKQNTFINKITTYLQIPDELLSHIAPYSLAAVERVFLRDRPVEGSSLSWGGHLHVEGGFVAFCRDVWQLEDAPEWLRAVDDGILYAGIEDMHV